MQQENRHTPKSDAWRETIRLITSFGNSYNHPSGLTVLECLAEFNDYARLVNSGYGADPDETQADRNKQLESCITQEDLDIILEFQRDLSEKVNELQDLFK